MVMVLRLALKQIIRDVGGAWRGPFRVHMIQICSALDSIIHCLIFHFCRASMILTTLKACMLNLDPWEVGSVMLAVYSKVLQKYIRILAGDLVMEPCFLTIFRATLAPIRPVIGPLYLRVLPTSRLMTYTEKSQTHLITL